MKRLILGLIIAISAIGVVSAQNWGNNRNTIQSVTVTGTLQLQNGIIAIASGNAVYFVPSLQRYIGFIDGLTTGASVSITGYASGNVLQPSQITVNGQTHDLLAQGFNNAPIPSGVGYGYGGAGCCAYGFGAGWGRRR